MQTGRTWTKYVGHRIATLFLAFLIVTPIVAYGQTVTAMWDPSPSTAQVTSYQLCIGTSSFSCNVKLASVSASQISYKFSPSGGVLHYVAVRAVNSTGVGSYSAEATFSIPGFPQPPNRSTVINTTITPVTLSVVDPDGSVLSYSHTGLPIGLTLSSSTGQISGKPTVAGTYNVTIFVADGLTTVSRSFTWTVTTGPVADTTAPALSITSHTSGQSVTSANVTISGTATDSGLGGSGITSVRVNGQAATGGTASGTGTASWSRAITLTNGTNTISVEAYDGAGNLTMKQFTLNYAQTVATSGQVQGVSAVSATPSSGSGSTRLFALQYADSRGSNYLATTWVWFNQSFAGGANSCMVYYERATRRVYLLNNAGTDWLSGALGSGTLENSQCAIALGSSSVALSGTTLTLNLAMTFKSVFGGAKNTYMFANASGGLSSGWQDRGDWTVPVTSGY